MGEMEDLREGVRRPFASLLRSVEKDTPLDTQVTVDGNDIDESARRELQEWWRTRPLGQLHLRAADDGRAEYARFYRRLANALGQTLSSTSSGDRLSSCVDAWVSRDWENDRVVLAASDGEAFIAVVHAAAQVVAASSAAAPAGSALEAIKKLRAVCSSGEEPPPAEADTTEKRPLTMAEKLSRVRSRRSTLVKEGSFATGRASSSSSLSSSDPLSAVASATPPTTTATAAAASSSRGDDDAAHYFTIETRHELKEQLARLQQRLDGLLLQTKLAWMKCFTEDGSGGGRGGGGDAGTATRLVTEGETLAFHLADAFRKAKTLCPIGEYKALVQTCEQEFDAFQSLVAAMAVVPSPVKPVAAKGNAETKPREEERVLSHDATPVHRPAEKPVPASFDLPSMKTYYEKAAPSYTAYLPSTKKR